MLLGEPAPTQADLHFRIFGFPVRVHPLFWVVTVLLGLQGRADPFETLVWVGVVFVSILVHELGHATLERTFGGHPWITLYSFGGLASCNDGDAFAGSTHTSAIGRTRRRVSARFFRPCRSKVNWPRIRIDQTV